MQKVNLHTHTYTHKRGALPHVDVTQWPCCHTQCPSATERHRGRGQRGGGGWIWGDGGVSKCSGGGGGHRSNLGRNRRKKECVFTVNFQFTFAQMCCLVPRRSFSSFWTPPPPFFLLSPMCFPFLTKTPTHTHTHTHTSRTKCTAVSPGLIYAEPSPLLKPGAVSGFLW